MEQQFLITHYYHSGFSIAWRHDLFVFDYWRGDQGELFEEAQLTEKELSAYRKIYVFITHDHVDHLDSVVFSWRQFAEVQYIVSSDMPIGIRGKRMAPGDSLELSEGLRSIGPYALRGCLSLGELRIPEGIGQLPEGLFYECGALRHLSLPASLREVGDHAFYGCVVLTEVSFAGTERQWAALSVGQRCDALLEANVLFGEEG